MTGGACIVKGVVPVPEVGEYIVEQRFATFQPRFDLVQHLPVERGVAHEVARHIHLLEILQRPVGLEAEPAIGVDTVPEDRDVGMRGDGGVSLSCEKARQAGHVILEIALELDRVFQDRVAAQGLELGVGGIAAEYGRQDATVAGLFPQGAKVVRQGVSGVLTGLQR